MFLANQYDDISYFTFIKEGINDSVTISNYKIENKKYLIEIISKENNETKSTTIIKFDVSKINEDETKSLFDFSDERYISFIIEAYEILKTKDLDRVKEYYKNKKSEYKESMSEVKTQKNKLIKSREEINVKFYGENSEIESSITMDSEIRTKTFTLTMDNIEDYKQIIDTERIKTIEISDKFKEINEKYKRFRFLFEYFVD